MLEVFCRNTPDNLLSQIQDPNYFADLDQINDLTQTLLKQIQKQSAADLQQLADWQDAAQESILQELYALLEAEQISLNERLVIVLNTRGEFEAVEHPQAEAVSALLRQAPALCTRMKLMGALALIERGLTDLRQARLLIEAKSEQVHGIFQACLCGSLSHFHLISKN